MSSRGHRRSVVPEVRRRRSAAAVSPERSCRTRPLHLEPRPVDLASSRDSQQPQQSRSVAPPRRPPPILTATAATVGGEDLAIANAVAVAAASVTPPWSAAPTWSSPDHRPCRRRASRRRHHSPGRNAASGLELYYGHTARRVPGVLVGRGHMSIRVRGSPKPAVPVRRLPYLWPETPAGAVNDAGILAPGPDDDEAAQG